MNWKQYEKFVYQELTEKLHGARVSMDQRIRGTLSGIDRQIDILVEESIGLQKFQTGIECKFYNKKVDIKCVESMIGMAQDIGLERLIVVTNKGYSEASLARVCSTPDNIELEILAPYELQFFQGPFAIPYSGPSGALLVAPFGWIVDADQYGPAPAFLYRGGSSFKQSMSASNFMYVNFWHKSVNNDSLEDLLKIQSDANREFYGDIATSFLVNHSARSDFQTLVAETLLPNGLVEVRGLIDFGDFIFFCVHLAPKRLRRNAVSRVKHVVWRTMPFTVEHATMRA